MEENGFEPIIAALRSAGLLPARGEVRFEALTGGVSSDIWLVEGANAPFVVKQALARLRVAADWRAPVSRNASEAFWLAEARRIAPASAPEILHHDQALGFIAMAYLPPDRHPVWKALLRNGHADKAFASAVGRSLAQIHAGTAGREDIAAQVNDDALFTAIRLDPYFAHTARRHEPVAAALRRLMAETLANRRALVHGDVSPKNILAGPDGPVFLDAECAWYGDPAFDLAFCLNHLLLKALWNAKAVEGYSACFEVLATAYLSGVAWEDARALEMRAARLLPGLLLARIDGKSPVEYITQDKAKEAVRHFAIAALRHPFNTLEALRQAWFKHLSAFKGAS
jgi:aminoglycoside phosphotransferase (APT) family kinase protein